MARIATGDWDAVIVAQSQFTLLPVHPRTEAEFIQRELAGYRDGLSEMADEARAGDNRSLKPEKTRIVHTLVRHDDQVGVDFLGFNVRQHRVGNHHTARSTNGEPVGFKAIISPSQDAQKRHVADMAAVLRRNLQAPQ